MVIRKVSGYQLGGVLVPKELQQLLMHQSFHLTANPFRSEATLLSSWSQAGEAASGEVNLTLTQKGSHNFLS